MGGGVAVVGGGVAVVGGGVVGGGGCGGGWWSGGLSGAYGAPDGGDLIVTCLQLLF